MRLFSIIIICLVTCSLYGQGIYHTLEDKTRIYIEEAGEGQPLLFVPGWRMTHRFFEHQKKHFSTQYRVITYDPRGQGRSDKPSFGNHYAEHASDLRQILTDKKLDKVVLVAWSSGCLTIYEYIRAFGFDKIDKLVFIDESPKWVGDRQTEWVYGTFDGYRSSLKGLVMQESDTDGIIDWMLKKPVDSQSREWMNEEMQMTPSNVALSLYVDGLISDFTEEVRAIKKEVPALFLVRDSWYDQAADWLKTNAPYAQVKGISSHAMFWEEPTKFNQILEPFLTSKN